MLTFKGICVSIQVDGNDLPVYAPEVDRGKNIASCFIASEAGKKFVISMKDDDSVPSRKWGLSCAFYFDGSKSAARECVWKQTSASLSVTHVLTSTTTGRPFVFSRIDTTDDESRLSDIAPPEPGSIRVTFQRVLLFRERKANRRDNVTNGSHVAGETMVHESSKKGGGNKTTLGQLRSIPPVEMITVTPYGPADTEPFVQFVFRHRPEAILRANDIIPVTPPPVVPEDNQDELSEEEDPDEIKARIRELEKREAQMEAERRAIEIERARLGKRKRPSNLKQEEIQPHRFFRPGQVIDLTDL